MQELVVHETPEFSLNSRPVLTIVAVLGMTVGLGLLYPSSLAGKTFTLLGLTLLGGLVGAWKGRALRGPAYWIAAIGSFVGLIVLYLFMGALSLPLLVAAMMGWGCLEGLILGPALAMYVETLGAETVASAFGISAAVMAACAAIANLTAVDTAGLGKWLSFGLLGLIVVAVIGMFRGFSERVSKGYALFGMALFTGYFLFDFARLKQSPDNTWAQAGRLAVSIYLDFLNFFLFLLRFMSHSRHR